MPVHTHCCCVWHGQSDGPPFSECHYHATLRAERDALRGLLSDVYAALVAGDRVSTALRARIVAALREGK